MLHGICIVRVIRQLQVRRRQHHTPELGHNRRRDEEVLAAEICLFTNWLQLGMCLHSTVTHTLPKGQEAGLILLEHAWKGARMGCLHFPRGAAIDLPSCHTDLFGPLLTGRLTIYWNHHHKGCQSVLVHPYWQSGRFGVETSQTEKKDGEQLERRLQNSIVRHSTENGHLL